ncbi:hypothetical protein [Halosquirtibacter xylanolyticus]
MIIHQITERAMKLNEYVKVKRVYGSYPDYTAKEYVYRDMWRNKS